MNDVAIRAESLSKLYRIGARERYLALRDTLTQTFTAPLRYLKSWISRADTPPVDLGSNQIWALKEVSFQVKRGEVMGIIGRNGAGKSTLLKILSQITQPTDGRAEIRGRLGSLLEVGTGFHPELTGRENIYLNGAIMGMRKREIQRKFDEIVAFAEVEKFIDTPVKRYSTGMYVRLAFAVAAHLEPEILLVDEVLAVGDISFQKKCLGKMGEVAQSGRTVLFVSHQMNSIRRLSDRCLWLHEGRVKMLGNTVTVVSAYEAAARSGSTIAAARTADRKTPAQFLSWDIIQPKSSQPNLVETMGAVTFRFILQVNQPIKKGTHGFFLFDADRRLIWGTAALNFQLAPGIHELLHTISSLPIRPGVYYPLVSVNDDMKPLDSWDCTPDLIIGTKPQTHPHDEWSGILNIPAKFSITKFKQLD